MFFKNSNQNKNLFSSVLNYFLVGSLFISSAIVVIILFTGYHSLRMDRQLIFADQIKKKTGSGLQRTSQKLNQIAMATNPKQTTPVIINNQVHYNANKKVQIIVKSIRQTEPISKNSLPLLARIIHAEAGGESLQGQVAVGAVLLNRIKSGKFPGSLAKNIFRPGEFESVSNGYIWSNPNPISYQAAHLALKGWDPTYGALYFFNPAKTKSRWIWSRPLNIVIGQHYFAS
jgi:spore germination cell wall hydrolase CwlJ-like protein